MSNPTSRRKFIRLASVATVAVPALVASHQAMAARNEQMRTGLKYQEEPKGDDKCSNCMHFNAGADEKALGTCNIFPGDDEISPEAWCAGWAKKA